MTKRLRVHLPQLRSEAARDTLAVIAEQIERVQVDGFWGTLPLALDVQDGVVTTVRAKGDERTYRIPLERAA